MVFQLPLLRCVFNQMPIAVFDSFQTLLFLTISKTVVRNGLDFIASIQSKERFNIGATVQ